MHHGRIKHRIKFKTYFIENKICAASGEVQQVISIHEVAGHTDSVLSLSTAPWDPKLFASSSKDNTFILWHVDFNDDEEIKAEKVSHEFEITHFYSFVYF